MTGRDRGETKLVRYVENINKGFVDRVNVEERGEGVRTTLRFQVWTGKWSV